MHLNYGARKCHLLMTNIVNSAFSNKTSNNVVGYSDFTNNYCHIFIVLCYRIPVMQWSSFTESIRINLSFSNQMSVLLIES